MDHLQMDLGGVLKGKQNEAPSMSTMNHSIFDLKLSDVVFHIKTHDDLVNPAKFQVPL